VAVTDGTYTTEEDLKRFAPTFATTTFDANSAPKEAEVDDFIEDVEAAVEAELAAIGFTVPIVGSTRTDRIMRGICGRLVAAEVLMVTTEGGRRIDGSENAYVTRLTTEARTRIDAIKESPRILVESGLTSDFANVATVETWQSANTSETLSDTPAFAADKDF